MSAYFLKRAARIYPALAVCAVLMVFAVGSMESVGGGMDFVFSRDSILALAKVLCFGPADIAQLTQGFIFSGSLNGSLWTLKIEVLMYLLIAVGLFVRPSVVVPIAMLAGFVAVRLYCQSSGNDLTQKLGVYALAAIAFCVGSILHFLALGSKSTRLGLLASAAVVLAVALKLGGAFAPILATISFSVILITLALSTRDRIIRGRFDASYGIYLYAFPVQQLVINLSGLSFYPSMFLSVLITVFLGVLSWFVVERPAIRAASALRERLEMRSMARVSD
jgi:peptidoglycan/LPS O-acetylase OafA/YrhL